MEIMTSGVLVKRTGRRFGNLREAKRVLLRQGKSARTVSGLLENILSQWYTYHSHPELFWVDLVFQNPLDTEVNLSNLTLNVQASHSTDDPVDVEIIKEVTLGAKETSLVS